MFCTSKRKVSKKWLEPSPRFARYCNNDASALVTPLDPPAIFQDLLADSTALSRDQGNKVRVKELSITPDMWRNTYLQDDLKLTYSISTRRYTVTFISTGIPYYVLLRYLPALFRFISTIQTTKWRKHFGSVCAHFQIGDFSTTIRHDS